MFLYPPHGVGRFSDLLAEGIRQVGGRILTDTTVTAVETARNAGHRGSNADRAHCLRQHRLDRPAHDAQSPRRASTTSISSTCRRFSTTSKIAKPPKLDYQWTYFGGDEIFSRVTAPQAFLTSTTPPGKGGAVRGAHVPRRRRAMEEPGELHFPIVADLVRTGRRGIGRGRGAGAHRVRAFHISDLQVELSLAS